MKKIALNFLLSLSFLAVIPASYAATVPQGYYYLHGFTGTSKEGPCTEYAASISGAFYGTVTGTIVGNSCEARTANGGLIESTVVSFIATGCAEGWTLVGDQCSDGQPDPDPEPDCGTDNIGSVYGTGGMPSGNICNGGC